MFFILLSVECISSAQVENALFREAVSQTESGNNVEAIETYDTLIQEGYVNQAIFHNLALLHLEEDNTGMAVLAYEKCIKLNGTKGICSSNLKILRTSIEGYDVRYTSVKLGLFLDEIIQKYSSFTYGLLSVLIFAIGLLLLQRRRLGSRKILLISIFSFLGLFILVAGLRRQYLSTNDDYGIIIEADTELLIGPDFDSKQLYPLQPGVKVKILRDDGEWLRVLLYNRDEGWVPAKSLGRI